MLDYAAFPDQRQALIRQVLLEKGRVVCAELSVQLGVSEHTIRRDLHELSKSGICKKVYGGAVAAMPEAGNYAERKTKKTDTKSTIAHKCAQLVKPNSCVYIDSGTTNLAMAEALPNTTVFTVVTNSPEIAITLLKKPLCEVIMLGGGVQRTSGGCVGAPALEQIKGIIFDQGFIGGCAMAPELGLTGFDYADCEFKKAVIRQCSEIIVGLTSDKIPAVARYVVADSSQIDVLVIEQSVSKQYADVFRECDIQIYPV
ncbi:DeoR/GlpR transcriptional regulator [Salmonella enterica subsp. enterica serovar Mississippi]|uniref:DeoR/GlpR transcriptional regulator n=7 Tax=Salmonella enterica I TaxID=59201 RepID=A0A3V1X285_SALET|nr:DeoR/GlpR family DNA-binding transcription regulator [Salmonella enterica]EAA2458840.1 DeoR/GlpR transcriptional regulator [Salmonella enterica subsp. enterica serovar Durham]EAA3084865.1 DeoR/GlpR transcriptional regulator [Salmonella enterica subsp. enterica serovar Telelkebir]EAA5376662.1 DeoR/GlpR transcriptional regulator [Salmonella enterica subsp. enterica serovar Canada]EAA5580847.1 DeoR/GlpR transcriptional regulator [Salmonella enterica subsp. enterica serovar Glostrup]EAB7075098.